MTKEMIERINALAKKKREEGLTPEEQAEQQELYAAYLQDIRGQVTGQLEQVRMEQPDGTHKPLTRKTKIIH